MNKLNLFVVAGVAAMAISSPVLAESAFGNTAQIAYAQAAPHSTASRLWQADSFRARAYAIDNKQASMLSPGSINYRVDSDR